MTSKLRRAGFGALMAAAAAEAAYKLHPGWSPRAHFPAALVEPGAKPNTWVFKTRIAPELEIRRGNWELRADWDRTDLHDWPVPRILQQMLQLGCEIADPNGGKRLLDRLYATRSLVPARLAADGSTTILHRLSVFESGCVIVLEARGSTKLHRLRVVVAPPPPPRKTN
jgi:hypothetical protein